MTVRKIAAALAATTLTFSLAACGSSQTVEEACKIVNTESKKSADKLSDFDQSDPKATAKAMKQFSADLNRIEDKLENEEVKAAFEGIADPYEDLVDIYEDVAAAGKDAKKVEAATAKLADIGAKIQKSGEKFDELCPADAATAE